VVIHPYFGFVVNPDRGGINPWGFFRTSPLARREPGKAVVIIFGGSVADQLFYLGGDALVAELERRGPLRGKHVELLSTALGGYKQPQQLLILSFFLSLGAEYDVVVNFDGFNEIDGPNDNLLDGVNPFFPHNWNLQARQGLDPEALSHFARTEAIRAKRRTLRHWFAHQPLPHSAFALALWDLLDQGQLAQLQRETRALEKALADKRLPRSLAGPETDFADVQARFAAFADVWERASLSMAQLCAAHGIAYFHFLQPNQYVPGSKPLNAEERRIAWDADVAATHRVEIGYPMLIERGRDLKEQGVSFVDLTGLFAGDTETIYDDTCCHVNRHGAEEMGRAVADSIIAGLR
jgi:hypothetical protein